MSARLDAGLPLDWLDALDTPKALCNGDGRVVWTSTALCTATGLSAAQAQAGADLPQGDACIRCANGQDWTCRVQHRAMPDGRQLIVLEDRAATAPCGPETTHLGRLLDLARGMGRVGVWERELPSLRGAGAARSLICSACRRQTRHRR